MTLKVTISIDENETFTAVAFPRNKTGFAEVIDGPYCPVMIEAVVIRPGETKDIHIYQGRDLCVKEVNPD